MKFLIWMLAIETAAALLLAAFIYFAPDGYESDEGFHPLRSNRSPGKNPDYLARIPRVADKAHLPPARLRSSSVTPAVASEIHDGRR